MEVIRGRWDAPENGARCRRDVTYGEDGCQVTTHRGVAEILAAMRNVALGLYALARDRGRTEESRCQRGGGPTT